ncbi:hypothetical protein A33M_1728 [Rhodovulum sp. PH10]|uniref:hypothetical protein n=1 Tax=Rhodovulum sp. PH10 TaxID=1187851 RepID=UPI00027C24C4|nr:hypothetical protein [Rhodovulum sp. PH10]EJW12758.1 hypothetical protein A33M_1728 [Rhodovulum sp. PH10]
MPADLAGIAASYAPYHLLAAFAEGLVAHDAGQFCNPYDGRRDADGQIAAQAWDRGREAGARYARALAGHRKPAPVSTRPDTTPPAAAAHAPIFPTPPPPRGAAS